MAASVMTMGLDGYCNCYGRCGCYDNYVLRQESFLHFFNDYHLRGGSGMAHQLALEFVAKSDPGMVREHNEDCFSLTPALADGFGLAILADGMGGHNAGEIASAMAIVVIRTSLETELAKLVLPEQADQAWAIRTMVIAAIKLANSTILDAAVVEPDYSGMGTTLVLALFQQERIMIAHVGDSRAYRFRQGQLERITRDHSILQEHIDAGLISLEDARFSQHKNIITRALGVAFDVDPDVLEDFAEVGDMYLLCSDGLSDMIDDDEIGAILSHFDANQALACDALVDAANINGGRDNVSVILIKVSAVSPQDQGGGPFGRILSWFK
jgi:serine/threonine protein phosphatase PrpC